MESYSTEPYKENIKGRENPILLLYLRERIGKGRRHTYDLFSD